MTERLTRDFFTREPPAVAHDLIGCLIVRSADGVTVTGRIVETEAYGDATDRASHTAIYRVSREGVMHAEPGTIYVYRSYGIHHCLNFVAHLPNTAGAVLIRALEPVDGVETMARRRGVDLSALIASGPGRVTQALAISLRDNHEDVVASNDIYVLPRISPVIVATSRRIGITRDTEREWRFLDPESPAVSHRSGRRQRAC